MMDITISTLTDATPATPTASRCSSPLSPLPPDLSEASSPLSTLSQSPPPPSPPPSQDLPAMPSQLSSDEDPSRRYPSPMSTVASVAPTPRKKRGASALCNDTKSPTKSDGRHSHTDQPATKKRKTASPKTRETEYLDLMKDSLDANESKTFRKLVQMLKNKKKIVVVAGAGISVSANIPDFRSAQGLFATGGSSSQKSKTKGADLFDASVYRNNQSTEDFHAMIRRVKGLADVAKPTAFHTLLNSIAQQGRLLRLYTQNIDDIDTKMEYLKTAVPLEPKGPWPTTIQIHGTVGQMVCIKCNDMKPLEAELFVGPEAPLCSICKETDNVRTNHAYKRSQGIGRLRPRIVLYNEAGPETDVIANVLRADVRKRPDAVLVIGTSLTVHGTKNMVKDLCKATRSRKDGLTAWINTAPEPKSADLKDCWDMIIRSKADTVATMFESSPYNCSIGENYAVTKEQSSEIDERWPGGRNPDFEIEVPPPNPGEDYETASVMSTVIGDPACSGTQETASHLSAADTVTHQVASIPTPAPSPRISPTPDSEKPTNFSAFPKMKQGNLSSFVKSRAAAQRSQPSNKKPRQPKGIPKAQLKFKSVKTSQPKDSIKKESEISGTMPIMDSIKDSNRPGVLEEKTSTNEKMPLAPNDAPAARPLTPSDTAEKVTGQETISPKSMPRGMKAMNILD